MGYFSNKKMKKTNFILGNENNTQKQILHLSGKNTRISI